MAFTSWRGLVGVIKPEMSAGPLEDYVRLMPEGIGLIQTFMNLPPTRGPARLDMAYRRLDELVGDLTEQEVDLVLAEGSAPYMTKGVKGERALVRGWEKKHKTTVVPTGMVFTNAMKAMKFKKIIGIRPFTWASGADYTRNYFEQAGFDVLTIASPEGFDHTTIQSITPQDVYKTAKRAVRDNPGADGIGILASIMASTDLIQTMEDDLGVKIVTATTARVWQMQKTLHVRQPREGYGALLRDLPTI